jgi:predicted lipid-binding transport protein (Tim44 family)
VFDPALPHALEQASAARVSLEGLEPRTRAIFDAMQRAWSSLAWDGARPYLSDRLWSAQTYWIAAYRAQGLRNVTENATIRRFELCRLGRDAHYLAATVRIHAESLDYTLRDADGAVVGGSRTKPRPYTEYWTLLRSVAEPRPDGFGCPACGAPLGHAMTMRCGHCGALVEASTFDWVLSRIDQDEVYAG